MILDDDLETVPATESGIAISSYLIFLLLIFLFLFTSFGIFSFYGGRQLGIKIHLQSLAGFKTADFFRLSLHTKQRLWNRAADFHPITGKKGPSQMLIISSFCMAFGALCERPDFLFLLVH